MTIAELIAAGVMTLAPMEGSYLVQTNRLMVGLGTNNFIPAPGYYLKTNTVDIVLGPGITLTNGWIQFNPGTVTNMILPGTPREGEVLTTEEVEVRPCFAAVYPPCPGHAHTNLTRWRWASGAWSRIPETTQATNANLIYWNGSPISATNYISSATIEFSGETNNIAVLQMGPAQKAYEKKLEELLGKLLEALKP